MIIIKQIAITILTLIISASSSLAFIPDNVSNKPSLCFLCLFVANSNGNMTEKSNQLARLAAKLSVGYQHDNMNRITNTLSLRSFRSFAVSSSYDSTGNRTNITYPGGLSVGYQYDEDNRLIRENLSN